MNRFERAQHKAMVGYLLNCWEYPEIGIEIILDYEDGTEGPGSWTRGPVEVTQSALDEARSIEAPAAA